MQNPFEPVLDKVFTHAVTGEAYGPIRIDDPDPRTISINGAPAVALAEDSCGNYFATTGDGAVWFWDHETDYAIPLAESLEDFVQHCTVPPEIELDPSKVVSAWIDPAFAKTLGVAVPKSGWIKRLARRE